jgi:glycosyltransferase involved in cell wall biosynthesis
MRILHVTQGYWPAIGGTELLIQRVSEELVAQYRDEVTVFTTDCYNGEAFFAPTIPRMPTSADRWETLNGVRVRRFPVWSHVSRVARTAQQVPWKYRWPLNQYLRALAGGPVIPGLTRTIAREPADVIAASSFPLLHMFAALHGARRSHRPCVLHGGLHPEDEWGFERSMIHRAIHRVHYIANTQYEADYVIARGARRDRVFVIGVGVDLEHFSGITPEAARAQLGVTDGPVVGFIGQIGGHKGVDTLLQAMPSVWDMHPDAWLLIAGGRTGFYPAVEAAVQGLPPARRARVRLLPDFPRELKGTLFSAVDVFAYPSGYESFGISFLEAWAAGKPVIGCRRGAIPTVIAEGRDGLLITFGDAAMLAGAIRRLLADPAMRRGFGDAGRAKVLERYTWPAVARRFREVYAAAISAG